MSEHRALSRQLEWGLQPPDAYDGPAWGARAIYSVDFGAKHGPRVTIELLWDRQSGHGTRDEMQPMLTWINESALEGLRRECLRLGVHPADNTRVRFEADGFVIEGSPRESHGYLYVVAYRSAS
jgi:hypothetical protein